MIAVFDSGVGGLSVLREIQKLWPEIDAVYFGDTAHVPYGGRSQAEIQQLSLNAVKTLMGYLPSLVVIACNTATSVALNELRSIYPKTAIVGVVPVVKTLAERSRNKRVAVIATPATLSSSTYMKLKVDFATDLEFLELGMPEWVMFVEHGQLETPETHLSIDAIAKKISDFGADTVALGSTHFPWLRPQIETALPGVAVLDSGPAVARQVVRVLTKIGKSDLEHGQGKIRYVVSGNPQTFGQIASQLLGQPIQAEAVERLSSD